MMISCDRSPKRPQRSPFITSPTTPTTVDVLVNGSCDQRIADDGGRATCWNGCERNCRACSEQAVIKGCQSGFADPQTSHASLGGALAYALSDAAARDATPDATRDEQVARQLLFVVCITFIDTQVIFLSPSTRSAITCSNSNRHSTSNGQCQATHT